MKKSKVMVFKQALYSSGCCTLRSFQAIQVESGFVHNLKPIHLSGLLKFYHLLNTINLITLRKYLN